MFTKKHSRTQKTNQEQTPGNHIRVSLLQAGAWAYLTTDPQDLSSHGDGGYRKWQARGGGVWACKHLIGGYGCPLT